MKKKYGVRFGILAMGLAVLGAPAGNAQSRMAAGETAGAAATSSAPAPASSPVASSPPDLDHRIEALESELLALKTELESRRTAEAAAPAVTPTQDAAAPVGPEKVSIAGLLGPTSLSGFVDTYYQVNFNHPNQGPPNFYPGTRFRAFDFRDKSIALNMVELILDKAPSADSAVGRTGYHVSVGYGDGMDVYSSFDPNKGTQLLLKEAYGSYLAPIGKGLQFDIGKFVTPMGSEVVESKDNWNYSRGLLFTWAIPFYHFGVRAKYTLSDKYSVTGFVVNGWNNVADNNSGKTYGFNFLGNPTKQWMVAINYLAGPEATTGAFGFKNNTLTVPASVNGTWRQTWDAVLMYTPNSKWSFMANYDYARGDRFVTNAAVNPNTLSKPTYWTGIATYAKYSPDDKDYFAGRYEYFYDRDGFDMGLPQHSHVSEFTATYQRTLASYLLTRFEYRRDSASVNRVFAPFALSTFTRGVDYQNTASISMILLFDSRNAK